MCHPINEQLSILYIFCICLCWICFANSFFPFCVLLMYFLNSIYFLRFYLLIFRERGREGDKHWCDRETLIGCLSYVPWLGIQSAIQVCALTRSWWPLTFQDNTHPTQPYWSGQLCILKRKAFECCWNLIWMCVHVCVQ